jgi:antitoxin Phd
MSTFTLTELSNKSGEILEAAYKGPVELTRHGKRKYVLLTAEEFDRMQKTGTQRAYRTDDLPPDLRDSLLGGLDEIVERDGDD